MRSCQSQNGGHEVHAQMTTSHGAKRLNWWYFYILLVIPMAPWAEENPISRFIMIYLFTSRKPNFQNLLRISHVSVCWRVQICWNVPIFDVMGSFPTSTSESLVEVRVGNHYAGVIIKYNKDHPSHRGIPWHTGIPDNRLYWGWLKFMIGVTTCYVGYP